MIPTTRMLLRFLSDVLRELRDLLFAWECEEHRSINRRDFALSMLAPFLASSHILPIANSLAHIAGLSCERSFRHTYDRVQLPFLSEYPSEGRDDLQRLWINNFDIGSHRVARLPIPLLSDATLKKSDWLVELHSIERGIPHFPFCDLLNGKIWINKVSGLHH